MRSLILRPDERDDSNSVTTIGEGAFQNSHLASVTLPNSLTSIGAYVFATCYLATVAIPNSITSIGEKAFYHCGILTSVAIGDSVTNIGPFAFSWCQNLLDIDVDAANPSYASAGGVLFNKARTTPDPVSRRSRTAGMLSPTASPALAICVRVLQLKQCDDWQQRHHHWRLWRSSIVPSLEGVGIGDRVTSHWL